MIDKNYQVKEELDLGRSVYLKKHIIDICSDNHYSGNLFLYKIKGHLVHYNKDKICVLCVLSLDNEIFAVKESELMTINQAKEYIKNNQEEKFNKIFERV